MPAIGSPEAKDWTPAVAAEPAFQGAPAKIDVARQAAQGQAALMAGAVFAAGITCWVGFDRPVAVTAAPEFAPTHAAPAVEPQPVPEDAQPTLTPFVLEAPQDTGGSLVPFSLLEKLRPALAAVALPKGKAAAMLQPLASPKADRIDAEPMLERSGGPAFNDLRLTSLAGGVSRAPDPAVVDHAARIARFSEQWQSRRRGQLGIAEPAPAPAPGNFLSAAEFRKKAAKAVSIGKDHAKYAALMAKDANAKLYHAVDGKVDDAHTLIEMSDGSVYASHSPLVFDLSGAGVRTSDRMIRFDVDGKGRQQRIHDIASGCGLLVFDADRDGVAGEHARELFGDRTDVDGDGKSDSFNDGFEALEALVRRAEKEKVLPTGSAEFGRLLSGDLAALHKAYGLGLRVGGMLHKTLSPAQAGVAEIALSTSRSVRTENFDAQGNDVVRRDGAVFVRKDGSVGAYEDVFFLYRPAALLSVAWNR